MVMGAPNSPKCCKVVIHLCQRPLSQFDIVAIVVTNVGTPWSYIIDVISISRSIQPLNQSQYVARLLRVLLETLTIIVDHPNSLKIPDRQASNFPMGYNNAVISPIFPEVPLIHPGSLLDLYSDVLLDSNYHLPYSSSSPSKMHSYSTIRFQLPPISRKTQQKHMKNWYTAAAAAFQDDIIEYILFICQGTPQLHCLIAHPNCKTNT